MTDRKTARTISYNVLNCISRCQFSVFQKWRFWQKKSWLQWAVRQRKRTYCLWSSSPPNMTQHDSLWINTQISLVTLKCVIPVVCIWTNKRECSQQHICVCVYIYIYIIKCYILRLKKLHISAGSGHHQVLSFDSLKIILYNSRGDATRIV